MAVQVVGVEALDSIPGSSQSRRILLGGSMPSKTTPHSIPMLYQSTLAWTENTWESGFVYRAEPLNPDHLRARNRAPSEKPRLSDINMPPLQKNTFCITWERSCGGPNYPHMPPEIVPGTLRSFFPAVLLRSRILTETARKVFLSRLNGIFLKQIIVSPGNGAE